MLLFQAGALTAMVDLVKVAKNRSIQANAVRVMRLLVDERRALALRESACVVCVAPMFADASMDPQRT